MSEISINDSPSNASESADVAGGQIQSDAGDHRMIQIGPDDDRVTDHVGPNQAETNLAVGGIRLRWLMPFARARRGEPYELWDSNKRALVVSDDPLPLRPFVKELSGILGCGTDLIYQLVDKLATFPNGPHNATAKDMLKSAQGGGVGTSRLGESKDKELEGAIWEVRVKRGMKPGKKAMGEIKALLQKTPAFLNQPLPGTDTIAKRWNTTEIQRALADPYARDHLYRLCGDPDKVQGLNSLLCIDCATMSNSDVEVRALDDDDRDLGPVTCVWGLNAACRGVWTVLGFPGTQNGFLVGHALRIALIDKGPLLKEYGLGGKLWPLHGRPGEIQHDHGTEFINGHIERALLQRDIALPCLDRSPAKTPHFRGSSERFHQSAQWLFCEFLNSDWSKKITRPVKGKPKAIGILCRSCRGSVAA